MVIVNHMVSPSVPTERLKLQHVKLAMRQSKLLTLLSAIEVSGSHPPQLVGQIGFPRPPADFLPGPVARLSSRRVPQEIRRIQLVGGCWWLVSHG